MLVLSGVSRSFGGLRALDGVSLTVRPGRVHALIGPNGAGKTTLLNVITGVVRATEGTVVFRDERIDRLRPAQIAARGVIRTFQAPQLPAGASVREAVTVGGHRLGRGGMLAALLALPGTRREEARLAARVTAILEQLDLLAYADRSVDAVPPSLRRQVELARALAAEPAVLVLDEPAAGMAAHEVELFGTRLRRLANRGVAVVLVEHNTELVLDVCDEVNVLDRGRLIRSGTPAEVRSDRQVVSAYLGGAGA